MESISLSMWVCSVCGAKVLCDSSGNPESHNKYCLQKLKYGVK